MTLTCRRMGTQIIGTTRVAAAAGLAGPVASRPRRALGIRLLTCALDPAGRLTTATAA